MISNIFRRKIIEKINPFLSTNEVIVLHGARQVGKTFIMRYLKNFLDEKKEITHFIDLEDSRFVRILDEGVEEFIKYLKEEGFDPALFNERRKLFVFIDEIQYLASPSPFLKLLVDHYPQVKLIVSGSSSFNIKQKFSDSLVGRTVNFEIFSLCFEEFLMFKGEHFDSKHIYTTKKRDELLTLYEDYILSGGYPKIVLTSKKIMKEKYLQQIIDTYIKKDIRDLAEIKDINKFNRLLEILASQSGQLLNVVELANTLGIMKPTVERYLFLLEQTYIVRLVRPYSTNLRSELSKTPKIFFYDSGLMQMLWLKELPKEILGTVFETSIFSELVKKYGSEKIYHWRTQDKKEIDFILKDGRSLLPIEAKLNFNQFQPTAFNYFKSKYQVKNSKVVGLRGEAKESFFVYPWQL
ncbi:MAG: ATP-binding protein [Patescibacteria group bacterium]